MNEEIICSYSREQALEDGVLVDVTDEAKKAGFKYPFAMTAEVWNVINSIPEEHSYESKAGRLWDVLMLAMMRIRTLKTDTDLIMFEVILHNNMMHDTVELKLLIGPGDTVDPVFTLMFPNQD